MIKDDFRSAAPGLTSPARKLSAVTPADGTDLPEGLSRGLFVAQGGTLVVRDGTGTAVALSSGDAQYHPIRVIGIEATGTSAAGIVALY